MTQDTDRELLEWAAKAAGIELNNASMIPMYMEDGQWIVWNPITDDGDALRLAVKLGMMIDQFPNRGEPSAYAYTTRGSAMQPYEGDPYAATRRAIVRAAAEIGKAMKC